MTRDNIWQPVFRRILAKEAGGGADGPVVAAAARRVCERFTEHLTALIGEDGVAAICARSLDLSKRTAHALAHVPATHHGSSLPAILQQALEQHEAAVATEGAVTVLATASELMASLIGEELTRRLLRQAWPEDLADDTTEERTVR